MPDELEAQMQRTSGLLADYTRLIDAIEYGGEASVAAAAARLPSVIAIAAERDALRSAVSDRDARLEAAHAVIARLQGDWYTYVIPYPDGKSIHYWLHSGGDRDAMSAAERAEIDTAVSVLEGTEK